jgi:hypothetical protein
LHDRSTDFNTSLAGVADTTAPTLSAGATSVVSTTAWTGVITTDEGNGVIYTLVNQSGQRLGTAVEAGGTSLPVFSQGQKSLSFPGLTADTSGYYAHIMHEDAAGNQSAVTTIGPFNTRAGAGTGTVSLTIPRRGDILSGGEGVGPFPMFFRTLVSDNGVTEPASTRSYDPTQAGFAYVVDLGLGGPTRYEYLTHVPDIHNNMNVAYAKEFSACYQPGTYTVVVNVFRHDGTFVGAGTQTFTIRDPLIEITSVFLVNNDGATDAAYPGAAAYTTLGQAIAAANTAGVTSLILMRRGQTHPQNTQIAIPSSCPHFIVSTYGTGTKPLVTTTFGGELIRPNDAWNRNNVYRNIRFQAGYNTITESGTAPTLYRTGVGGSVTTKGVLFDGCEFDGFNQAANLITGTVETNHFYMLHNCKSDIGRGFYVFQGPNSGTYVSFRGTSMLADPRHALGGGNGGNLYGCMRIVCAKRLLLESSEFFSRATPSATSNFNLQPTLRLLTAPEDSQQRMFGYMTGCYVDGGNQAVTLPMSNGSQARRRSARCELPRPQELPRRRNREHEAGQHADGRAALGQQHHGPVRRQVGRHLQPRRLGGILHLRLGQGHTPRRRGYHFPRAGVAQHLHQPAHGGEHERAGCPVLGGHVGRMVGPVGRGGQHHLPAEPARRTEHGGRDVHRRQILSLTADRRGCRSSRTSHKATASKPGPRRATTRPTPRHRGRRGTGGSLPRPLQPALIYDDFYNVARGGHDAGWRGRPAFDVRQADARPRENRSRAGEGRIGQAAH